MNAKTLLVLIPLLVLLGTATAVAGLEARRTPDWQAALAEVQASNALSGQPSTLQHVAHARTPQQFQDGMGSVVSDDWRWQIERLPRPPQELYCVLLGEPDPGPRQVVYVAHLSDALYRAGWVVYAGPRTPFPPELVTDLAALGCDLEIAHP